MAIRDLDQFILSAVNSHWQKVAMIVAKAMTEPGLSAPDADHIAARITALVGSGDLEIRGNPENWRSSEVRRINGVAGAA